MLCGIGRQLVKDRCHCLSGFWFQCYARTTDVIGPVVGREFALNDLRQRYAMPVTPAQQFMRSRQRLYAAPYPSHEVIWRTTSFLRLADNSADRCKHILNTVVEFSIQCALMLLRSFALCNVDVDAYHSLRFPVALVRNESARLDPSNRTVGSNDAILDVTFTPLLAKGFAL